MDTLEIILQSNLSEVESKLDGLIAKFTVLSNALDKISQNKSYSTLARDLEKANKALEKTPKSNGIDKTIADSKKSFNDYVNDVKQKMSEEFTPTIKFETKSVGELETYGKNFEKQVETASRNLERIKLTGYESQTKGVQRYVAQLIEAEESLKKIEEAKAKLNAESTGTDHPIFFNNSEVENATVTLEEYTKQYEKYKSILETQPKDVIATNFQYLDLAVADMQRTYPEAKEMVTQFEELREKYITSLNWATGSESASSIDPNTFIENFAKNSNLLQEAMNNIQPLELPTDNIWEFNKAIVALEERFEKLNNKMEVAEAQGKNEFNSAPYMAMQLELQRIILTLDKYKDLIEKVKQEGALSLKIQPIDQGFVHKSESAIDRLKSKMRDMRIVIPTDSLKEVESKIKKVEESYNKLVAKLQTKVNTNPNYATGTDFKRQMADLQALRTEYRKLMLEKENLDKSGGMKFNYDAIKKFSASLSALSSKLSKVSTKINAFFRKIVSAVKPIKKATKSTHDFSIANADLVKKLTRTTKMLSLMIVRMALRQVIDKATQGFKNLAQYSDTVNGSLSLLWNSFRQLGNAFASAVAPMLNAFAPALNYIIQLCVKAVNVINQLISALTGAKTWTSAKTLTDSWRDSLDKANGSAKELKKTVLGFDELNQLQDNSGGGGGATSPMDMFEEAPIESKWLDLANKIKQIASKLFEPIKKAWDKVGDYVKASWKRAFEEVGSLLKDIGQDFIEVWNEEATVRVLEEVLYILGDIGQVVGNLAENFHKAWNENDLGKRILEDIRDILGIIVSHIHKMSSATVEWSKNLDFVPLLTKLEEFLESVKPVADEIWGVIEDFYTKVVLPFGTWLVEEGIPDLIQVFIDFNNEVDWEGLRSKLSELWEHLEPFAETVGEGLILFIDRCADALAEWVNDGGFDNFVDKVIEFMDSVDAEDVANALELLAKALIGAKVAIVAFGAIKTALDVFKTLAIVLKPLISLGSKAKTALKSIGDGIGGLITTLKGLKTGDYKGFIDLTTNLTSLIQTPSFVAGASKVVDLIRGTWLDPDEWDGIGGEIYDWLTDKWDKIIEILTSPFTSEDENGVVKFDFSKIFNFDTAQEIYDGIKDCFDRAFDGDSFAEIGTNILAGIAGGLLLIADIFTEPINDLFKCIWDKICEKFGIASPAKEMKPIGEYILLGIVEGFKAKFDEFTTAVQEWFDTYVKPWFTKDRWTEIFNGVKEGLQSKWEEISEWFNENIAPWFTKDKWIELFGNIKDGIEEKIEEIKKNWDEKWDGFKQKITDTWDNIKSTIKGAVEEITGWVNSLLDIIGKVKDKVQEITHLNFGKGLGILSIGGNIPRYATGGMPEDGFFYANHNELVGGFNGRTAVANNEQIVEGIKRGVFEAVMSANASQNSSAQYINNSIQVDGETIARVVTKAQSGIDRRYNPRTV